MLNFVLIATLAICNLHSPALLHAHDSDHDDLGALVDGEQAGAVDEPLPDSDHGIAPANDHHAPSAVSVADMGFEAPLAAPTRNFPSGRSAAMYSWATAPPTQPPSA